MESRYLLNGGWIKCLFSFCTKIQKPFLNFILSHFQVLTFGKHLKILSKCNCLVISPISLYQIDIVNLNPIKIIFNFKVLLRWSWFWTQLDFRLRMWPSSWPSTGSWTGERWTSLLTKLILTLNLSFWISLEVTVLFNCNVFLLLMSKLKFKCSGRSKFSKAIQY